jgi:hypothetical protein
LYAGAFAGRPAAYPEPAKPNAAIAEAATNLLMKGVLSAENREKL